MDHKYRHRGIGELLMQAFERECRKRGVSVVMCYGYEHNQQTIKFFKHHGYVPGSLVREFQKNV